jgi:neutral ceramidase
MAKRLLKKILVGLLIFIAVLLVFVLVAVGIVDRTPASALSGYQQTFDDIEALQIDPDSALDRDFSIGFSKINLTPPSPVALAGYGNRKGKHYTTVADSIFVRAIVVDNGLKKIAIVSADLLLIPPKVTEALQQQLPSIGYNIEDVFLGATHTHNSIGNWGEGAAGILYGSYEESMIQFITSKMLTAIIAAGEKTIEGRIGFAKISNDTAVDNRLIKNGPEDPFIRLVEFTRNDSVKLLLTTYAAHATCLYSKNLELSGDYPGKLVEKLEKSGYDFAMFMAGAVGSHKPGAPEWGFECFEWMADELVGSIESNKNNFVKVNGSVIQSFHVPLYLSDPQVKVTPDLKVRSWLFRSAFGEYRVHVSALRIGDLVMLGTPADLSGEFSPQLDSVALSEHVHVIPTSFNGGYIGYLTPKKYYDNRYFETQLMNWYAPGTGEFVRDVMAGAITKIKKPASKNQN